MNILHRRKTNFIEGIWINDLERSLRYENLENIPQIDSVVFDNIILKDGRRIKCIKNYYKNNLGQIYNKRKSNNECVAIKNLYNVDCKAYNCVRCHQIMLSKRRMKEAFPV